MAPHHTVATCLNDLGVTAADFAGCDSFEEEFTILKRIYHAKILTEHPDKGGNAADFRKTRAAWEVLRQKKANGSLASLTRHLKETKIDESVYEHYVDPHGPIPSYEHFAEAAATEVPGYKVEIAKSARSQCVKCKNTKPKKVPKAKKGTKAIKAHGEEGPSPAKKPRVESTEIICMDDHTTELATINESTEIVAAKARIEKNSIRVGSLDDMSGGYGRWHHLECWRVPSRVWGGLTNPESPEQVLEDLLCMDEVLLTGLSSLTVEEQLVFVEHVMNQDHWAKKYNRKNMKPPPDVAAIRKQQAEKAADSVPSESFSPTKSTALVSASAPPKQHFEIPRPGVNGAIPDCLEGKTFVLTGVFPEIGGGKGLNLGKDKCKGMIESFGGRVTSAVSGKTNYLVVGKDPGASKVSKAMERSIPLIDVKALQDLMLGKMHTLDAASPPRITGFSAGYGGNGHARLGF